MYASQAKILAKGVGIRLLVQFLYSLRHIKGWVASRPEIALFPFEFDYHCARKFNKGDEGRVHAK